MLFTYHQEKFELKHGEIPEFIQKSLDHVNLTRDLDAKIGCTPEEFLHELSDAVNLMTKDGLTYVFVHRSFQEYFAAYWVIFVDTKRTAATLEEFAMRPNDNLILLAYKMNKLKVDDAYVLSMYDRLVEAGQILKSKPKDKPRWQYISNYKLKISWRSSKMASEADAQTAGSKKKTPKKQVYVFNPSWDNGEIGIYYTVLDQLVFKRQLRSRFYKVLVPQSHSCRPAHLLSLISSNDITGLSVSLTTDGHKIAPKIIGINETIRTELDGQDFFKDEKFTAKVETAFDEIEEMLHTLNKSVNGHVTSLREGHSKSLKSLDEMFFS